MGVYYDYRYRGDPGEFMRRVAKIPNLDAAEELTLIRAYREHGSPRALSAIFAAHQKLMVRLIKEAKLMPSFGEALSAANLGLQKAIQKFEEERGFRLNTYAKWWINAELSELYGKTSIVKLGTSLADKNARVHLSKVLNQVVKSGKDPTHADFEEMAKRLGLPRISVEKAYYGAHIGDVSIDGAFIRDGDDHGGLHETLADTAPSPEDVLIQLDEIDKMRSRLYDAMQYLDERQRYIFTVRRLEDPMQTLEDLSLVFNMSRERIRQIEMQAMERIDIVINKGPEHLPDVIKAAKREAREQAKIEAKAKAQAKADAKALGKQPVPDAVPA